jgi:hypothetical protein
MPDDAVAPPPPAPRKSCLRRVLGCLGIAFVLVVLMGVFAAVVPGTGARASRRAIQPGMTPSQVLVAAGGWFTSRARPDATADDNAALTVSRGRVVVAGTGDTVAEGELEVLGLAIEERMRAAPGPWTMRFGYITIAPTRLYFTVHFDEQGRVVRVGEAEWGRLN